MTALCQHHCPLQCTSVSFPQQIAVLWGRQRVRCRRICSASAAADQPGENASTHNSKKQGRIDWTSKPNSRWQRLQDMVASNGPGAFFAYITVSNMLSVGTLCSAWLLFTRSSGQTPLQSWPQFIACYAGVYAAQHLARPYKLAAGLAAAPVGNAAVRTAARLLRVSNKIALVVLLLVEAVVLLTILGCVVLYAAHLVS